MEKWAIISIVCTDGKIRLGINTEDDSPKGCIVMGGLHEEYASAICMLKANELGLEPFDNTDPDYDMKDFN